MSEKRKLWVVRFCFCVEAEDEGDARSVVFRILDPVRVSRGEHPELNSYSIDDVIQIPESEVAI